ncbi:uncharacterized protein BX663DRAFT_515884 [Cokeromyces recurvatus]|uniref:uncharacterized protein n=1 Tax=Cokeromyces recurvatus TaxID=90255 RepID=UPI00221EE30A|nr:uncharacterized protein BX663DRAFT_515884 [Cokeromyces recurvatus]KAI7900969.1 hypothetical protein BX663DRAFT_515884 [Cokeromyces recurvatus]
MKQLNLLLVLFFYLLNYHVNAFDFKSILFGSGSKDSIKEATTTSSIPFGTPIVQLSKSDRRSNIPCNYYLCKDTETCVKHPLDCPCRLETDKKCIIGDNNWFICIRGDQSCDQL